MDKITSFKQKLKNYKAMTLIDCSFKHASMNVKREISLVNTVQFALKTIKYGKARNYYMRFPKAGDYEYDKEKQTIRIQEKEKFFIYQLHTT